MSKILNDYLEKWQKRLRLQDWEISIRWAFDKEISEAAEIGYSLNTKEAEIKITKTDDKEFIEFNVIHELVHLHFAPNSKHNDTHFLEEQAINAISKALQNNQQG